MCRPSRREKKRETLSYARTSWADYFRFKALWPDEITIILLPAARGQEVHKGLVSESQL